LHRLDDPYIEITLQTHVENFISMNGNTVGETCEIYLQTIHRWMPVLSRKRIYESIVESKETLTADLSSLLLSMYLIIQIPPGNEDHSTSHLSSYHIAKSLYEQASILSHPSLSLIQSCLLIATFEHCHGRVEAACLSIRKCAKMATDMRLNEKVSAITPKHEGNWELVQEEINLWWGIVIRERYFALVFIRTWELAPPNPTWALLTCILQVPVAREYYSWASISDSVSAY
jgi:hypothetical protein